MIRRLIAALWLGSACFLILSASAAFRAAPTPTAAADVVGAMLTRWHYIALAAPLILFGLELRRAVRPLILSILFSAVMLAAAQSFVDLRIRNIRSSSLVSISDLPRSHPIRQRFGRLHGVSMLLLALQAIGAAVVVAVGPPPVAVARKGEREDAAVSQIDQPSVTAEAEEPPVT